MSESNTTSPGYLNRNRQRVIRATALPGTDHLQKTYVLRCEDCCIEYGANGSDIFERRCPKCQFTVRLREIIEQQLERTRALEKATGCIIPSLFHRKGKTIKTFRRSWLTACIKAGLGTEVRSAKGKLIKKIGNRIPHDFRRTAVRNLERAGVSRSDAMKMVGHRTEAIYRRYAIADEKSMKEAAEKLDQLHVIDRQPKEASN